jgi:hypothetical protein
MDMNNEPYRALYERLLFIEKLVEVFHMEAEDADMMLDYIENGHSLRDAYHITLDLVDNGECDEVEEA